MLAMHGIGFVMPLYYFLHYMTTPIVNFKATDMRLTDLSYTGTVLPVHAVAYYGHYLLGYLAPEPTLRHIAIWVWHLSPLWATLGQCLLARTTMPRTGEYDRTRNVTRDLWPIRITIGTLTALSGIIWLSMLISAPFPLKTIFIPSGNGLETF